MDTHTHMCVHTVAHMPVHTHSLDMHTHTHTHTPSPCDRWVKGDRVYLGLRVGTEHLQRNPQPSPGAVSFRHGLWLVALFALVTPTLGPEAHTVSSL